jgi:hypothetical protein
LGVALCGALMAGLMTASASAHVTAGLQPDSGTAIETPEIRLVKNYNTWLTGGPWFNFPEQSTSKGRSSPWLASPSAIKAYLDGLQRYITDASVLHEAPSLPWGGTMVGFDGWVRFLQTCTPIYHSIFSMFEVSQPAYWQHDNAVIKKVTITMKPTERIPNPFYMEILEIYTIDHSRIKQIDEYYEDTAGYLARLKSLGVMDADCK